ncbi:MAG: regulating kinase and related kinase [Thermoproteota archaeon]|nr:regulating kinase and related kinase [Thermoproteota archaeon]
MFMPLIRKGAEADLFLEDWYGLKTIRKMRKQKAYRITSLDTSIRRERTSHEAQIMHEAKLAGVPTPTIYMVDMATTSIIMEYIEGTRIKEALNELSSIKRENLCNLLGQLVGKLHLKGIIHGDLTTSNMIEGMNDKIFIIDFGLAEYSEELEKRGVDLLLLKRALQSTHYAYAKECYDAVVKGYSKEMKNEATKEVTQRVKEIENRGRYAVER